MQKRLKHYLLKRKNMINVLRPCRKDFNYGSKILYGILLVLCLGLFTRQAAYCTIRYFEYETTVSLDVQRYFLSKIILIETKQILEWRVNSFIFFKYFTQLNIKKEVDLPKINYSSLHWLILVFLYAFFARWSIFPTMLHFYTISPPPSTHYICASVFLRKSPMETTSTTGLKHG